MQSLIQNRSGSFARTMPLLMLGFALTLSAAKAADSGADASKPVPPPPGAKNVEILFSGKAEELQKNWVMFGSDRPAQWKVQDGYMVTSNGDIATKKNYKDFRLHVEFRVPLMPEAHGQERGNSGVYLQALYEVQVLDSYGIADPGRGDCGAIYDVSAPLVNATRKPLEWQTYDIIVHAARYDTNTHEKTEPARITVLQNGVVVQNNTIVPHGTGGRDDSHAEEGGPIELQFHGNTVAYRNVWIEPLPLQGANHY